MHVLNHTNKLDQQLSQNDTAAVADTPVIALNKAKSERVTYHFVDLIRFVSTIGIVFIHAEFFLTSNQDAFFHKVNHIEWYFAMRNTFKFATICYFIIAGFLLAGKIEKNERLNYFMRRLKVIVKPYVFAILLFMIGFVIDTVFKQKITGGLLLNTIKYVLCYTSFWYVPNYLICLAIIVLFSKYTDSIYFGLALLLTTAWYTYSTVYSVAHTSSHTTALFGFVFYMWLGIFIKRNNIIAKIQQMNLGVMVAITIMTFALSNLETWYLFHFTHTRDSLNTLRIGNQLFSVAMFALLVKLCNKAPNFGIFRPKQETYGIYLYHSFFIFFFIPEAEKWICNYYHFTLFSFNIFQLIAINLFNFIVCYFGTTYVVKALIKLKLAYLPYE